MMAALRPISTKEIDRIRDAQPVALSVCGTARSRTSCRSALMSPHQEIHVALRSRRHQIVCGAGGKRLGLDRQPGKVSFRFNDSCRWRSRGGGAALLSLRTEPIVKVIPI